MPATVHLDAAAAVPLHPAARQALMAALDDGWSDPSRLYGSGRRAQLLLEGAREAVADVLGARADEVAFAGSGTAALQQAIAGVLPGRRRAGATVVHSAIEHSAVLRAVTDGTAVPVDRQGRVEVEAYDAALRGDGERTPALACLISASHEVGTVQPVADIAALCAERGVPLLVDAAQSVGRAPVPAGWSLLTASAHKWGGPPGVGVLAVRTGTRFVRVPAGPPNLPGIVAAAVGLQAAVAEAASEDARLRPLVDRIRARVAADIADVEVVGDPVDRLPHLVTFSCLYLDGQALLTALDRQGFAVSSGSSCTADTVEPSHVLAAMGVLTHGNVRVSLHRGVTEADVDRFLAVLPRVVADLRAQAGVVGL
ncbi:MAG: cysteine desulfurase/sulfurtransferase TusA family protein [Mycobacteriales bacterium]